MQRVSSQATILFRIVLPTAWITVIVSITILLGWTVRGKAGLLANPFIWIGLLLILFTGFVVIWFGFWRIYRVDMDTSHLYVSNYLQTYRYPWNDLEEIRESQLLPGRLFCLRLKAKGSFGKNIYFLASQVLWNDFVQQHPDLVAPLQKKSKEA